jgi:hypothetical protein
MPRWGPTGLSQSDLATGCRAEFKSANFSMDGLVKKLFGFFRKKSEPETSEGLTLVLGKLFNEHGLACLLKDGWIVGATIGFAAQARLFWSTRTPAHSVVQLDVEVRLPSGECILESCAGFSSTPEATVQDALRNLVDSSFHAIYSAISKQECSHCFREDWAIGGHLRPVILGPEISRRGSEQRPDINWFGSMEPEIRRLELSDQVHWIRLYHAHFPGKQSVDEALLDNDPHQGLQSALRQLDWPCPEKFYSFRIFLIIGRKEASG